MNSNILNTQIKKEQYGEKYHDHILEQYKLYVETTDKVSERRMAANTAFISIETLLLGTPAFFNSEKHIYAIAFALVGIFLSITLLSLLNRYRQLNSAKFNVVKKLEAQLPTAPFDEEWSELGREEKYRSLSACESALPILFAVLYCITLYGVLQ